MKFKNYSVKIEAAELEDGFVVETFEKGNDLQAWLYQKDYGVKSFVVGCNKEDFISLKDFLLFVLDGIDDDIELYELDFMD